MGDLGTDVRFSRIDSYQTRADYRDKSNIGWDDLHRLVLAFFTFFKV
jgi:hypothetical protein